MIHRLYINSHTLLQLSHSSRSILIRFVATLHVGLNLIECRSSVTVTFGEVMYVDLTIAVDGIKS